MKSEYQALLSEALQDLAALRKQRDFLLESNNRLVEERRAAEADRNKAYCLLDKANDSRSELLDKLEAYRSAERVQTCATCESPSMPGNKLCWKCAGALLDKWANGIAKRAEDRCL